MHLFSDPTSETPLYCSDIKFRVWLAGLKSTHKEALGSAHRQTLNATFTYDHLVWSHTPHKGSRAWINQVGGGPLFTLSSSLTPGGQIILTWGQIVLSLDTGIGERLSNAAVQQHGDDVPGLAQLDSHVPPGVPVPHVLKDGGQQLPPPPRLGARVHASPRDPEEVRLVGVGLVEAAQPDLLLQSVADGAACGGHEACRQLVDVDAGPRPDADRRRVAAGDAAAFGGRRGCIRGDGMGQEKGQSQGSVHRLPSWHLGVSIWVQGAFYIGAH